MRGDAARRKDAGDGKGQAGVLRQIGRRLRHVQLDLHRTRLGIDARVDVGQRGGKALAREGVGRSQGRLAQGQPAQMPLVQVHHQLRLPFG